MTEKPDAVSAFEERNRTMTLELASDDRLRELSREWLRRSAAYEYSYHFTWLGRPIIQYPQDMVALQEILWRVRPDVVVETGIAHGGSLVLSASILELIGGDHRRVVGVDIDIRPHNRTALEEHPLFRRIDLVEGSSVDPEILAQVRARVDGAGAVVVLLDSNHTHEHVLRELQLYSPFVTPGSYLIVYDTFVEDMDTDAYPDRPWGPGNNPHTAVEEFLATTDRFEVDRDIDSKLLVTVAPGGYLRCVR